MQGGKKSFLTEEETKKSMRQAVIRMLSRKMFSDKLGGIHYAVAKYDKLTRITIPFGKDGLILVSTEPGFIFESTIEKILELRNKYQYLLAKENLRL